MINAINLLTHHTYNTKNALVYKAVELTGVQNFAGFHQWKQLGFKVKKGAIGFKVWIPFDKKTKEGVSEKRFATRTIFHQCQVESIDEEKNDQIEAHVFDKVNTLGQASKDEKPSEEKQETTSTEDEYVIV